MQRLLLAWCFWSTLWRMSCTEPKASSTESERFCSWSDGSPLAMWDLEPGGVGGRCSLMGRGGWLEARAWRKCAQVKIWMTFTFLTMPNFWSTDTTNAIQRVSKLINTWLQHNQHAFETLIIHTAGQQVGVLLKQLLPVMTGIMNSPVYVWIHYTDIIKNVWCLKCIVLRAGILEFAVLQYSFNSYFQANLTIKKPLLGTAPLKYPTPSQIHLIKHTNFIENTQSRLIKKTLKTANLVMHVRTGSDPIHPDLPLFSMARTNLGDKNNLNRKLLFRQRVNYSLATPVTRHK